MNSITDRRHHERHPAAHLDVLARTLHEDDAPWALGEVVAVDFNQYGIALDSTQLFTLGDQLKLVICTDDGVKADVTGVVCHRTSSDVGYRYGLHFDFTSTLNLDRVQRHLAAIENVVAKR
jgi:hypothetical protein